MAAYAALISLMQIIHQIKNHPSPPISLDKQQVESLTEKVTFLLEFLECYNSPYAYSDAADPLESRIADAAYAAEDVIEFKIVDLFHIPSTILEKEIRSSKVFQRLLNSAAVVDLQQVMEEIDLIKNEVMKTSVQAQMQRKVSSTHAGPFTSTSTGKDSIMVGFEDVLLEVLDKLTEDRPERRAIPIVGMGGIGKTTLARTVYSKPLIKEYFDICAWTTISQQYNTREILCELLSQATNIKREELSERSEDKLGSQLYKYLFCRRFLIVMDDIWSVDVWDKIQHFFPNNGNGSRILVTTRLSQLSSQLNNNYSLQMKFLDEISSWDLFSKTVFGEGSCPLELEDIGKKIVENCRGLPLSIIVVGGLLKKMEDTRVCWESIRENLTSVVNLDNDKHCFKLLKMSYNHLPVYLKPCFLYMGVFEEDNEIVVSTLINLWVSEGFLKPIDGKSLEAIAEGFLKDLVDRNLVLIHKLGCTGNIKCCKIHDLLRDFCLREGEKDGFYHVIGHNTPQGLNSHLRRVVIHDSTSKKEIVVALQSMWRTRSIICGNDDKVVACPNSGLLRTLNAYNNHVNASDWTPLVFQLVNLRHVIVELHTKLSINHLWSLHTLIVYSHTNLDAPAEIWKMSQLRHIEFIEHRLCLPDPPSGDSDVVVMENLQTLKGLVNFKCGEEVVKRIPNIKRLLVEYDKVEDCFCLSNIESMCKLESLTLSLIEGRRKHELQKLTFPHSIKKLTLTTGYDDSMLEKIGSLPLLQKLKMVSGTFTKGKWEIVEGRFPCLKSMTLLWCRGLKQWTAEESTVFPCLEKLRLSQLTELKEIPSEIGDIPTLRKIELLHCSESVVKCARKIVEEQEELQDEQLLFRVLVVVRNEALKSLASSNFEVEVSQHV